MMGSGRSLALCVAVLAAACGDDTAPRNDPDASAPAADAGPPPGLSWLDGGADIPEYSLGRLLLSHPEAAELTVYDLDTSSVAGRIPFEARAELEVGGGGRYAYAHAPRKGVLHVIDPGQWLLSHIDHFHVVRGAYSLMAEQVSAPMLTSLLAHDGWITAYSASAGSAALFQERSITARSFTPYVLPLGATASSGVALVSRAQLVASEGAELTQRSVLDTSFVSARFAGCGEPRGIAAHGERLFIGCAQGLLQLVWDASLESFVPELLPIAEGRVMAVRTTERFDGAVLQIGARTLGLLGARGAALRRLELGSDIVTFELRRQGHAAIVLTRDGVAHELDLASGTMVRTAPVLATAAEQARVTLSHAYAYITDPLAPRVVVLRLRTMQLETELALTAPGYDVALVGVPGTYTDDRE